MGILALPSTTLMVLFELQVLLRDVWGYDWSGGSNVVEVVISALRRKLGDRAGSLQTVRGAGYRFQR